MKAKEYPQLKPEHLEALRAAVRIHGTKAKEAINQAWLDGNYRKQSLESHGWKLQQIRNQFGPTWLHNINLGELLSETSNEPEKAKTAEGPQPQIEDEGESEGISV